MSSIKQLNERIQQEAAFVQPMLAEIGRVIVGQDRLINRLLVALLSDGHVLIEGVPGLAKTLAVRSLAATMNAHFQRIQFTPDLLPADITGTQIYNLRSGDFTPRQGPVFTNILLADEINRAPAKVQSALLEAMEERQVTLGEQTYRLPEPFMVLATQNPIEYEGTFPLPEAQLDRFLLRLRLGYPNIADEMQIMDDQRLKHPLESLKPVVKVREILQAVEAVKKVYLSPAVKRYIVELSVRTRQSDDVYLGASPRGSLALARAGQARAALQGRDHVLPDDIKALAVPVLAHRIIVSPAARLRDLGSDQIVQEIVLSTSPPGGSFDAGKKKQ